MAIQAEGSACVSDSDRWLLASLIFDQPPSTHSEEELNNKIEQLVDLDPFMNSHEDMKKPDGLKHVDTVALERQSWDALKTVLGLVGCGVVVVDLWIVDIGICQTTER